MVMWSWRNVSVMSWLPSTPPEAKEVLYIKFWRSSFVERPQTLVYVTVNNCFTSRALEAIS